MHLSNFCGEKHLDFKTFKRSALPIRQIEYLFHWLLNCKCILDIFMDESQTMERSYLWCSFSHFIYILESFEQCRLNTFLCYAMLLATAFTNFHHAITTRFKCTSCAVDLSNERQLQKQRHHFFFFLLDTFNFLFITSPWSPNQCRVTRMIFWIHIYTWIL